MPVNSYFFDSGTLIWWPKGDYGESVPSLSLQFWHNNSIDSANFLDRIVGTHIDITQFQSTEDIRGELEELPAVTNVYQHSISPAGGNQSPSKDLMTADNVNGTITEVRVSGNVTGILIPNAKRIVVRVLVPVLDGDKELIQDTRYVEWNAVSVTAVKLSSRAELHSFVSFSALPV